MIDLLRRTGAASTIVPLIALLLVFVAIASIYALIPTPSPPIEAIPSISPAAIRLNEYAKLTLTIKNLDLKTHNVRIVFEVSSRLSVFAGTEQLLSENNYSFTLESSDPSEERVFMIKGSLEEGITSSEYIIVLRIYSDGNEMPKTWNDLTLTVKR